MFSTKIYSHTTQDKTRVLCTFYLRVSTQETRGQLNGYRHSPNFIYLQFIMNMNVTCYLHCKMCEIHHIFICYISYLCVCVCVCVYVYIRFSWPSLWRTLSSDISHCARSVHKVLSECTENPKYKYKTFHYVLKWHKLYKLKIVP